MLSDILKAKRQMRSSANPFVPKTWVVSMDVGYSSIAAVSPNKLFSIPMSVRKSEITDINDILPDKEVIRYRSPDGTIYDVGSNWSAEREEREKYISGCGYWEQVDMLRILTETALGVSLFNNFARCYNDETIRAVCCLPPEYEESSNFTMLKTMLEGYHKFSLLPAGSSNWLKFDFAVKSAVVMPKDFANSYFDLYCDKTTHSDIINGNPPMFRRSIGLYLHYFSRYS